MHALFDPLKDLTTVAALVLTLSLAATTAAPEAKAGAWSKLLLKPLIWGAAAGLTRLSAVLKSAPPGASLVSI